MDFTQLEKFIMEKMSETKKPGLSIALILDGEVVYSRGFGFRSIESGAPATPKTIYGVGSITKSFTALSIMQLVEKGLINLEDPVENYVPIKLEPFGEPVRIHHLLSHSSGIPSLGYAEAFLNGLFGGSSWLPIASPDDVVMFAQDADKWAFTKPGERFFYSNTGYVLLGKIISEVSKMSYEEYVKKNILEPLEMKRSYFFSEELREDSDIATGYVIEPKGKHIPWSFPPGITSDGGLLSNVLDLTKYLTMYINRGKYNGEEIISRNLLERMETPHIKLPEGLFGEEGYGYGWDIHNNFLGELLIEHAGSVLIYTGFIGYIPKKKIGVAMLSNSSGYPLMNIGMYALSLLLGKDPEKLPFIKRERILRRIEGTYSGYKGTIRIKFKRSDDFFIAEWVNSPMNYNVIFVPETVEDDFVKFYTISNGIKSYAEFYIKENTVELIYDRYKLVKNSTP